MDTKRSDLTARNFPSAEESAECAAPEGRYGGRGSSYRLAFTDVDFLLQDELRPVRMQLELLKPEMVQQRLGIESTIVMYGSARVLPPDVALQRLEAAEAGGAETVELLGSTGGTPAPEAPPPNDVLGYGPIGAELDAGKIGLVWADAQAYADNPDKVIGWKQTYAAVPIEDVDSVRYNVVEMMRRARREAVITSPYLIPGPNGMETLRHSIETYHVQYTLVTNSLAATDEPVVHTGYRRYRPQMLALGVNLYELSPQRVSRSLRLGRFSSSIGRLHAKSAVVDQEKVFIGSMNFDPRSDQHNTEMGLFIDSPVIAQQVLKLVDVIRQQGAYRVTLAADGRDLVWTATDPGGVDHEVEEPETDIWTRAMLEVLSVITPEGLL